MYSALQGSKFLHSIETPLVSGKFQAIAHKRNETPWEIKFISEWIGATIAGWKRLTFFVEDEK